MKQSFISHLVCSLCGDKYDHRIIQNYCTKPTCHNPLLVVYDYSVPLDKNVLKGRVSSMWRYRELLPVIDNKNIVTLGEGMTPLLITHRIAKHLNCKNLFIKDESHNPTGSFKARGLGMAISKAKELGVTKCAIPTAGNAGGAMAAYCASAAIEAHVFMPSHTPNVFKKECEFFNAHLTLLKGTISDCGKMLGQHKEKEGWYDVSTLKEPYRVEGKKTMGYEIAEQLNWILPDVILYPTGGGTGLIGMWKAFEEMEKLGWIGSERPRMIAVQASGCAPVVKAFESGAEVMEAYADAHTIANGLCVPKPFADRLILKVLHESKGLALTVNDDEIMNGVKIIAAKEGMLVAPEGGALYAALIHLLDKKLVSSEERIVLLNTGSGYKYIENYN
ncbi:MAG: threonine synthase [Bacteroidia bacterium]